MCFRPAGVTVPGVNNLPNLSVSHPEVTGSSGVRVNVLDSTVNEASLWRFLKKAVVQRSESIDCLYSCPVTALIQDPDTKAIVGVEIERNGERLNIAARNGVVLACGGFENNETLMQQASGNARMLPMGTIYNEGDGVALAQGVGARMWHMNVWESGGVGLVPESDRMRSLGAIDFLRKGSVILVGGDGRRYIAEDAEQRGGLVLVGGSWAKPARPERNVFIFDEKQRLSVKAGDMSVPFAGWSIDLSEEVYSGKVVRAADVQDLARALDLDGSALASTVESFNAAAQAGFDALGRKADSMRALGSGPLYAIEVVPSVMATRGGPERTTNAEVVGADGDPIGHLYSAGELGGVTSFKYQGGDGLSECVVFGKIAGERASQAKEDALGVSPQGLEFVPGCGEESVYSQAPDDSGIGSGEAFGIADGLGGPLWVKVKNSGGGLEKVEVVRHSEHPEIGTPALETLVSAMNEASSKDVDDVSGATVTSQALKRAIESAM